MAELMLKISSVYEAFRKSPSLSDAFVRSRKYDILHISLHPSARSKCPTAVGLHVPGVNQPHSTASSKIRSKNGALTKSIYVVRDERPNCYCPEAAIQHR